MMRGLDVVRHRQLAHVHLEDLLAAAHVGQRHHDLAVEAARAQQRRIEHVRAVGGGDDDDALVALEAVHLHQQLVQRLLALVVTAAQARAAMAADRVDLVDEDDARRMLLGLLEHVAHARGADADEHLDEVGTGDGEERHLRLAGDGARQQGLAGTGRAHHQHAARNLAAELLELARVAQELDHLGDLLLGLLHAGDVGEGDLDLVLAEHARPALAEGHGAATACPTLHLAHEEDPHADQQQHREPGNEDLHQHRLLLGRPRLDLHVVVEQVADQPVVTGAVGGELLAAVEHALNGAPVDGHALHATALHFGNELRVRQLLGRRSAGSEVVEHGHQDDRDDHPEDQILRQVIQVRCPHANGRSAHACRPGVHYRMETPDG